MLFHGTKLYGKLVEDGWDLDSGLIGNNSQKKKQPLNTTDL